MNEWPIFAQVNGYLVYRLALSSTLHVDRNINHYSSLRLPYNLIYILVLGDPSEPHFTDSKPL